MLKPGLEIDDHGLAPLQDHMVQHPAEKNALGARAAGSAPADRAGNDEPYAAVADRHALQEIVDAGIQSDEAVRSAHPLLDLILQLQERGRVAGWKAQRQRERRVGVGVDRGYVVAAIDHLSRKEG